MFSKLVADEFLTGSIEISRAYAQRYAESLPEVWCEIEIDHQWNRGIICSQFILSVGDRIHDHFCWIGEVFDIGLIPVIIQLNTQSVFQVDDVFIEVEALP